MPTIEEFKNLDEAKQRETFKVACATDPDGFFNSFEYLDMLRNNDYQKAIDSGINILLILTNLGSAQVTSDDLARL